MIFSDLSYLEGVVSSYSGRASILRTLVLRSLTSNFFRLLLNGIGHLTPVLAKVLDPLEGGDQLERDKALFVTLDMLEQELVLGDVGI